LGSGRFAAKTPNYERWISLDFLGFSRPDRDLSMSYEDFSREKNSRALFRDKATEKPPRPLGIQNAQDYSSPKLSFISDFTQSIVVQSASVSAAPSKSNGVSVGTFSPPVIRAAALRRA
jgi:hypothetical protein